MKRVLLTCTDLMTIQFMVPHIRYLAENGFNVELACSVVGDRLEDVKNAVGDVAKIHTLRLERSPFSPNNLKGYGDLKKLLSENTYDVIWTNEPVMGVMTRFAARKVRKKGTKVIYMAHGFHFFKGAPLINWLMWAPTEIIMSKFNDLLVTINWEDYNWAKKHTFTPVIKHIDGIGVDFSSREGVISREEKRAQLNIADDDILVLSVGELQKRKNHQAIIRAIAKLNNPHIKYIICGQGVLENQLRTLVAKNNLDNQVFFLGYRQDIPEIMSACDIFAHPSIREGLGLASLEAMASGLPLITSNVQGVPDYVENGVTGYMCSPMDVDAYAENLKKLTENKSLREKIGTTNITYVQKYRVEVIEPVIKGILDECTPQKETVEV